MRFYIELIKKVKPKIEERPEDNKTNPKTIKRIAGFLNAENSIKLVYGYRMPFCHHRRALTQQARKAHRQ